ncbi:protein of unknown function [Shewanella benthica]|uniref:Uncharacterized protein n=1 Tax=Shewanella benthica TaxID=43661 RepID=A0A330LVC9_9GAMM|nr:protein of unknown function [Shewanella benthica]
MFFIGFVVLINGLAILIEKTPNSSKLIRKQSKHVKPGSPSHY